MSIANALQVHPASQRNAAPILEVLARILAPGRLAAGTVLEIASGTGYHAATFAEALPHLTWQPSDADADARTSIAAYVAVKALSNLRTPIALDAASATWPIDAVAAVVCINMIHISPWTATQGLLRGCGRLLPPGGHLITYGPYSIAGDFQADSNLAFDQSLRARNPTWGIRDVNDVAREASGHALRHDQTVRMPANNLMLIFTRT